MKPYPANTCAAGWARTHITPRFVFGNVAPLFVCLVAAIAGAATTPTTLRLSEYQKQNWQVEDGLPENYVRMIAQNSPRAVRYAKEVINLASLHQEAFRREQEANRELRGSDEQRARFDAATDRVVGPRA